jgi:hypothetical protein
MRSAPGSVPLFWLGTRSTQRTSEIPARRAHGVHLRALLGVVTCAFLATPARAQTPATTTAPEARPVAAPASMDVPRAPSAFWLVSGLVLAGGGIALNIDSSRRIDAGERGCFTPLEVGGCYAEALVAGPLGILGGFSVAYYGYRLGEHDAAAALGRGMPVADQSARRAWALTGTLLGAAVGIGINLYVAVRMIADVDIYACEEAPPSQRADACYGGNDFLALSIVQSAGYALMVASIGPLGYAQGYDTGAKRGARARAMLLPWIAPDQFGLALDARL